MELTASAAEAPFRATTSKGFSWSTARLVTTTWVSQRKPSGKDGRSGRSIRRAGQDRLLGGTTLTAEERSGDLPGGVHPLFEVDGEGEEIDALPHRLVCSGGYQHLGTAESGDHGSVRLTGEFAGAQDELFAADGPRYGDFGH